MKKVDKIEKFDSSRERGFKVHDVIRSGRSIEIDPLLLSSVIEEIRMKLNEVIDRLNKGGE
jgi:hypothetical protein